MKNVLIVGATSTIAVEVINLLGKDGCNFALLARNTDELNQIKVDLLVKNPQAKVINLSYDAEHDTMDRLDNILNQAFDFLGTIDLVLIAHGNLPNQELCQANYNEATQSLQINGLSVIELCHKLANRLNQGSTLAVISSVAGLRGRQSNYIYGTAKGMVNIYLQGLRNQLFAKGIHVLTIMPGFVDTKMTTHLPKGMLWASPKKVAKDIVHAINSKKNILYTPWFWRYIMVIVGAIPEFKFKTMKL